MTGTRKTLEVGLALALFACQQTAAEELPASNLLGRFRLLVEPASRRGPGDVRTLPLTKVNKLMGDQKIILAKLENYIDQKKEDRKNAWVAFYVVSPKLVELGRNGVYDNNGPPLIQSGRFPTTVT